MDPGCTCWRRVVGDGIPFAAANASGTDRVAEIPANYNFTVFCVPALATLTNVTIVIDGGIIVNNNLTATQWPARRDAIIAITGSADIEITGSGVIDGQGYDWWWAIFLGGTFCRAVFVPRRAPGPCEPSSWLARVLFVLAHGLDGCGWRGSPFSVRPVQARTTAPTCWRSIRYV